MLTPPGGFVEAHFSDSAPLSSLLPIYPTISDCTHTDALPNGTHGGLLHSTIVREQGCLVEALQCKIDTFVFCVYPPQTPPLSKRPNVIIISIVFSVHHNFSLLPLLY